MFERPVLSPVCGLMTKKVICCHLTVFTNRLFSTPHRPAWALQLCSLLHSSLHVIWTVGAAEQAGCPLQAGPNPGVRPSPRPFMHLKKGRWNITTWLLGVFRQQRFAEKLNWWSFKDGRLWRESAVLLHAGFHNMQRVKIGKRRTSADCRLRTDSIIHENIDRQAEVSENIQLCMLYQNYEFSMKSKAMYHLEKMSISLPAAGALSHRISIPCAQNYTHAHVRTHAQAKTQITHKRNAHRNIRPSQWTDTPLVTRVQGVYVCACVCPR